MKEFFIRYQGIIILVIIVLFGYFEVSFFLKTLKFDALYVHFPWRYLIVESIRNGVLPLWNYYLHLGLPIHADPQSGAWYPIVWIMALFGKYTLYSFNFEYIIHILIAAIGFYKLLKRFNISEISSVFGGAIYVFSGFFVGHGAHFTWIISIAWIPWILLSFFNLLKNPTLKNSIYLALVSYLLLTGGYPAFSIIILYILFFWGLVEFIKSSTKILMLKYFLLSLSLVTLLSSAFLISTYISLNYFVRGQGINYEYASQYAINFKSLISLFLPFAAVSVNVNQIFETFGTDISMTNLYIGIFPLILASIYPFYKKKIWYLMVIALLFLAVSFGNKLLIHRYLFEFFPGFNLFRFPALFRFFFMSIFIALAAASLDYFVKKNDFKLLKNIVFAIIIILISVIFYLAFQIDFSKFKGSSLYNFVVNLNISERIFFQSILQLIILIFGYIILKIKTSKNILLPAIIIVDLLISFQIYAPFSLYQHHSKVANNQEVLEKYSKSFSLKSNDNIFKNSVADISIYPFDKAFNVYESMISYKGNYSFILKNTSTLMDSFPDLFHESINGSVISFATLEKIDANKNSKHKFKRISTGEIQLSNFSPNSLRFKVKNHKSGYLFLVQNYYPGWKVKVNGISRKIILANTSFMAVFLAAGANDVEFYYQPKAVIIGFYISVLTLISVIIFFIISSLKAKK